MPDSTDTVSRQRAYRLGKERRPLSIAASDSALDVSIPVRSGAASTFVTVVLLAIFAIEVIRVVGLYAVMLPGLVKTDPGGALFVVGGSLSIWLVTRMYWVLLFLVALYRLFGSTTLHIEDGRLVVRKGIGRMQVYFSSLDFQPGLMKLSSSQDQAGRWILSFDPSESRMRHSRAMSLGAGHLSEEQADEIVNAVSGFMSQRLTANKGFERDSRGL